MILCGKDGFEFRLSPGTFIFGRDENCQIPLNSKSFQHISRSHLELSVSPAGAVSVRDLNSANGSFLAGARLGAAAVPWETGNLEIGTSGEFIFQLRAEPEPVEAPGLREPGLGAAPGLRESAEAARLRKRKFLKIDKPWREEDIDRFFSGLDLLPGGEDRRFFLSLVGLTPEYLEISDENSLAIARANLGLPSAASLKQFIENS